MSEPLFDLADEYDAMLARGLRLSGEDKRYFIEGRLRELKAQLPEGFRPARVLELGCGTGETTAALAAAFAGAEAVGVDTAPRAVERARAVFGGPKVAFHPLEALPGLGAFDLCYVNGVFHHIAPGQRPEAVRQLHAALRPGGRLSLFENNPWNPGARWVMRRIPFDRDAVMLWPGEAERLLREGGLRQAAATRTLFYFPRPLAALRRLEPSLARLPLGAQYHVQAVRPAR